MKYFLDTEFITGFKKPIKSLPTFGNFNKPEFFIQLISIGIVCEDGREFYAVSNEFDESLADDWVKENVISKLEYWQKLDASTSICHRGVNSKKFGKSIIEIRNEVVKLLGGGCDEYSPKLYVPKETEIYAYFADYDWVVFCNLFGRMIDLPEGMPMYCKDLKQYLDDFAKKEAESNNISFETALKAIKESQKYPKQENEHSALDDARWNYKLFKFLTNKIK